MKAGTETRFVQTHWDMNGLLTVVDHEGGEGWSVESDVNAWRSPIVVGDTLIADHSPSAPDHADSDYPENSLVAFDIADGSDRWILEFDDELSDSGGRPAAADENTLYLEADGELVTLRAADDTEPDDGDESSDDDPADEDDDGDAVDDEGGDPDTNGDEDESDGGADEPAE